MNTETGLLCGRDGSEPECQSEEFQLSKASYAIQANANALKEGLKANVWYSLTGWRVTGLVDKEMIPYPVYDAYAFHIERFPPFVLYDSFGAQIPEMYGSEKSDIPIGAHAPTVYEIRINSMPVYIVFTEDEY